jgi:hypothetical protein
LARLVNTDSKRKNANICYQQISIAENDKPEIRHELETYFGISAASVFDDLQGFAGISNGRKVPLVGAQPCLAQGKRHHRQEKYESAIHLYSTAINCAEPTSVGCLRGRKDFCTHRNRVPKEELVFRRGLALHMNDQHFDAQADFASVCASRRIDPSLFLKAHRWRIATHYATRDYAGALRCCTPPYPTHLTRSREAIRALRFWAMECALILGNEKDSFVTAWSDEWRRSLHDRSNYFLVLTFFGRLGNLLFKERWSRLERTCRNLSYVGSDEYVGFRNFAWWDFRDIEWVVDNAYVVPVLGALAERLKDCETEVRAEIALAMREQDELLELHVFKKEPFIDRRAK